MNDLKRRDIEKLLDPGAPPAPPPGLAERLKAEIPDHLSAAPDLASGEARAAGAGGAGRRWLLAASVLVALGGGLLAYRVLEERPLATTASDRRPVSGPESPAAEAPARAEEPAAAVAPVPLREEEIRQEQTTPAPPPGTVRGVGAPAAAGVEDAAGLGEMREAPEALRRAPSSPSPPAAAPSTGAGEGGSAPAPQEARVRLRLEERRAEVLADAEAKVQEGQALAAPERRASAAQPESVTTTGETADAGAVREEPEAAPRDRPLAIPETAAPRQRRADRAQEAPSLELQSRFEEPQPRAVGGALAQSESRRTAPPAAGRELRQHVIPRPAPPPPSTGGTDEPNQQPYGDVFFRSYGVNPFIDTEDDPLSTFGLEVDTASYSVVRGYLRQGHLPPPEAVRVEELLNSFDYGDRPPGRRGGRDFALYAEGAPSPFADGPRYQLLRFGIRGREVSPGERRPAVLTFVVDVSGSMQKGGRLSLVKQALYLLLDELRPEDRVGLVTYGDRGRVLVEPTGDREAVRRALASLVPGGSTNAEEGLVLGYELARRHLRRGGINRVILCSDGVANVGRTGAEPILERVAGMAREGIELTTVGVGMGNYNDVLLEQLADRGNGRYAYVDTLEEAERIFVEDLTGQLQTIAAEARAQVEFDPSVVARYRLLGYENRDIPDERFEDLSVDAGEIGAGHSVVALYEIKLQEAPPPGRSVATLRLRYGSIATREAAEESLSVDLRDLSPSWDEAPRGLHLAAVVAELAEILRGSYWAREGDLDHVLARARRLPAEFPGDPRIPELVTLIQRARDLTRTPGPSPDEP